MDDLVLNVRQVYQYPLQTSASQGDVVLLQQSGPQGNTAGPYGSMNITDIVTQARKTGGPISLVSTDFISWSPGPTIAFDGTSLNITGTPVTVTTLNASSISSAGDIFVNGIALADQDWVTALFDSIVESSVWTVNGRKGNVVLGEADIRTAGGVTANSPRFSGIVIAPTPWNLYEYSDRVVTAKWVQNVIACRLKALNTNDINNIFFNSPPGVFPMAPSPALGDASNRIATTMFVDESLDDLRDQIGNELLNYSTLYSPNLTGIPTAPTAAAGTQSGQIATTAFVMQAIVASTTGVSHFNGRTGSVTLEDLDITGAGGALLNSPQFIGTPLAPTAAPGTNNTQIATTAFVLSEVAASTAGVVSFNGRSGAVTLSTADVTGAGGAPIMSPALTGTPTAPTAATATSTNQLATTAFVQAVVAANAGVSTFNGRQGAVSLIANDVSAVGGALLAGPIFTGQPQAPTAAPGTSTAQLATTAFVAAAIAAGGVGVSSFNARAGAVTLTPADVTAAAPPGTRVLLMSQTVSGTPVAAVNFFYNFTNLYDLYEMDIYNYSTTASDGTLWARVSVDGATFDAGGNYAYGQAYSGSGGTSQGGFAGQGAVTAAPVGAGVAALPGVTGTYRLWFALPWASDRAKGFHADSSTNPSSGYFWGAVAFAYGPVAPLKGLQFTPINSNISRGVFNLYGIVKTGAGAP